MAKKTRQIYRRIQNVRHVRQITKAMYAIAATQVIQRKRALAAARPFGEASEGILAELWAAAQAAGLSHPLISPGRGKGIALLVVNADRGLCGRYVGEVNRAAERLAAERGEVVILAGGTKAWRHFHRRPWPVEAQFVHAYDPPHLAAAIHIQDAILDLFPDRVREVWTVYMHFRGELAQTVRVDQLLPLRPAPARPSQPLAEPELAPLLDQVIRLHLVGRILRILLSAKAAEQAVRRQAMKAATDNADELLERLSVRYNKARQQGITREILDIMGGVEALRRG
ncbi:MAG: ATP synthase F1 subunit gamma [Candidatus Bipolaricaulaceae bacterium]